MGKINIQTTIGNILTCISVDAILKNRLPSPDVERLPDFNAVAISLHNTHFQ